MATYPGMNLRGEVRESVSLDEDDLSDVEDEVFIRDGKSGYKFEDMSAKKPLMAPRRKVYKSEIGGKFRNKPQCKALCRLCCYAFIALTVLIGLIVLVVILVSLFPLPLDKLKEWIISKTNEKEPSPTPVPCNKLNITDVWTINFPKLVSDTSVQIVDVNLDGVDDIIFGFGTSDDHALPPDVFCNIFMGKTPPCQGGVMALNGTDGQVLWRSWFQSVVYTLVCSVDVNGDNITDCLITGKDGIFLVLNAQNGSVIWKFDDKIKEPLELNIYLANFISDQDNDTVPDILASHTSQKGVEKSSCLLVISGKTGSEIQKLVLPKTVETYYTPQLLLQSSGNHLVLFGTGSLTKPGNLSIISLKDLLLGNMTIQVLYKDLHKGVLSEAVLVDITGDGQDDIITALLGSTVLAIDGNNFSIIWNYTMKNSETLSAPTPGYFNSDNVTDFLIKYQVGQGYPVYYYSQTIILDGKTGNQLYSPWIDTGLPTNSLTISLEGYGNDFFLYWITECKNFEQNQDTFEFVPGSDIHHQIRADLCKLRFNSSITSKLYALNEFDEPPGIEVYNSENRIGLEYNNTIKPMEEVRAYLEKYPEVQFNVLESNTVTSNDYHPITDDYEPTPEFKVVEYKDRSSFRHKDNGQGLIKDFGRDSLKGRNNLKPVQPKYESDYESLPEDWPHKPRFPNSELDPDYKNYPDDLESDNVYSPNKLLLNQNGQNSNRDPRSKTISVTPKLNDTEKVNKTMKKNLSDSKPNIYDYKNMERAHTRLLHDLNNLPNEILSETYFKNRENQLRKSRFEERDLKSHEDHIRENENIKKVIELEKSKLVNMSASLWDLESEKELQDRDNGYWRGKREVNSSVIGIPRLSSIGALTSSFNSSDQSIDLIFITSWVLPKNEAQILLPKDLECINEKLKLAIDMKGSSRTIEKKNLEELFMKQCLEKRGVALNKNIRRGSKFPGNENFRKFPYLNQVSNLGLGQLTVYRLKLKCVCRVMKKNEKCVQFLQPDEQRWGTYLGKAQNGIFKVKP